MHNNSGIETHTSRASLTIIRIIYCIKCITNADVEPGARVQIVSSGRDFLHWLYFPVRRKFGHDGQISAIPRSDSRATPLSAFQTLPKELCAYIAHHVHHLHIATKDTKKQSSRAKTTLLELPLVIVVVNSEASALLNDT